MRGVTVQVAFGEYVVPPISLRMDYDFEADRDIIGSPDVSPKEWTDAMVRFLLAILRRNYPALTEEQFFETASSSDLVPLLVAARNQSGYKPDPLVARASASPAESSSASSSTQPAGSQTTSSTA